MRGVFKTTDGGKTWTQSLKISREDRRERHRDGSEGSRTRSMPRRGSGSGASGTTRASKPGFNESGIFKTTDARQDLDAADERPAAVERRRAASAWPSRASNPNVVYAFYDNYECDTQAPAGRTPGTRPEPGRQRGEMSDQGQRGLSIQRQGREWTLVSGQDEEQRAFMKGMSSTYAWVFGNIRVDPTDENTIYTLALGVSVSRDGGKTFGRIGARRRPPAAAGAPAAARRHRRRRWTRRCRRRQPRDVDRSEEPEVHAERQRQRLPRVDRRRPDVARAPTCRRRPFFDIAYDMDTPFRVVRIGAGSRQLSRRRRYAQRPRESEADRVLNEGAPGGEYCSMRSIRGIRTSSTPAS